MEVVKSCNFPRCWQYRKGYNERSNLDFLLIIALI